jgi:hypothetical protein
MAESSVAQIPAGWYPDPLGLPQRRWWDSSAWTQHVVPVQPATQSEVAGPATSVGTLTLPTEQHTSPGTGDRGTATGMATDSGSITTSGASVATAVRPAVDHAYIPMAMNTPVQFRQPDGPISSSTVAVWLIALMPAIQLAAVLGVIFGLSDFGSFMQLAVGFVFFLWTAVLASNDKRRLLSSGHREAATPWWLLLTPLAYLIARTVCVGKQGGRGSAGPLWVYIVLATAPFIAGAALLMGGNLMSVILAAAAH